MQNGADDCKSLELRYGNPKEFPVVLLASHAEGGGVEWLTDLLEVASGIFCGRVLQQQQSKELPTPTSNQFIAKMQNEKRDFSKHYIDDGTRLGCKIRQTSVF